MKKLLILATASTLMACDPFIIVTCTDDLIRQNGGLCDKSGEYVGIGKNEQDPPSEPPTSEPPTSEPPTSEPPTSEPPTSEPPTSEPPSGGQRNNRSGHGDDTNPGGQDSNIPGRENPGKGKGNR